RRGGRRLRAARPQAPRRGALEESRGSRARGDGAQRHETVTAVRGANLGGRGRMRGERVLVHATRLMIESAAIVIRVGVVGLGFGALPGAAFRRDPRGEVVAGWGRDEARARAAAEKLGVPAARADWRRLVEDPRIDAVSLAVPAPAQLEIGRAALAAGKH